MSFMPIIQLGMPIALGIGGLAAWRMSKNQSDEESKPGWRDTSLDDWREERDRQAEAERESRTKK